MYKENFVFDTQLSEKTLLNCFALLIKGWILEKFATTNARNWFVCWCVICGKESFVCIQWLSHFLNFLCSLLLKESVLSYCCTKNLAKSTPFVLQVLLNIVKFFKNHFWYAVNKREQFRKIFNNNYKCLTHIDFLACNLQKASEQANLRDLI